MATLYYITLVMVAHDPDPMTDPMTDSMFDSFADLADYPCYVLKSKCKQVELGYQLLPTP